MFEGPGREDRGLLVRAVSMPERSEHRVGRSSRCHHELKLQSGPHVTYVPLGLPDFCRCDWGQGGFINIKDFFDYIRDFWTMF